MATKSHKSRTDLGSPWQLMLFFKEYSPPGCMTTNGVPLALPLSDTSIIIARDPKLNANTFSGMPSGTRYFSRTRKWHRIIIGHPLSVDQTSTHSLPLQKGTQSSWKIFRFTKVFFNSGEERIARRLPTTRRQKNVHLTSLSIWRGGKGSGNKEERKKKG